MGRKDKPEIWLIESADEVCDADGKAAPFYTFNGGDYTIRKT